MRKFLVFLFLIFFVTCGPTESEIQQRINEAVSEATSTSTSTTTSLISNTDTTIKLSDDLKSELALRYSKDYINIYNSNWPSLINFEILEVGINGYWIYTQIEGVNLFKLFIRYSNGCTFETTSDFKQLKPNQDCKEKKYTKGGFEQNVYLRNIQLVSNSKNSVTGKNINIQLFSEKGNGYITLPNGRTICCHKFNFQTLENSFLEYFKFYFKEPPSITTTTTTSSTTSTTTTTSTTIYTDTEAPVWSNDPISFSKVNPTYLDILWGQANDNEGVAEFKIYSNGNLVKIIPAGSINRTTVTGLSPNTSYTFEILACDFNGNCSTNNPSANKKTSEGNSSTNSDSNNLSNVGPIPEYLVQLSELNGVIESALCVYPFNGICNVVINSDGAQDFLPRLYFPQSYPDNCDTMQIKYSTNTGYNLYDTIFAHNSSTLYDLCFSMDKLIEIGYTYDALYGEEFLNSYGYAICDDWYLEEFTITYKNSTRLTYFRNGSVGYYEYYELKGVGTHNFNFSNFDFESVRYNNPGDPNWASRESSIVDCEY